MKKFEAMRAFGDSNRISVKSKSGCEYVVYKDTVEASDSEDPYVYGERSNGSLGGPFSKKTQGQIKWFYLRNMELAE